MQTSRFPTDEADRGIALRREAVDDRRRRANRWRFFQIMFALVYSGLVLDVVTTAIGIQVVGSSYEQNPIGSLLLTKVGSIGVLAVLTGLSALFYLSSQTVYWRMSLRWTRIIDVILFLVATTRWVTVLAAIAFLMAQPGGLGRAIQVGSTPPAILFPAGLEAGGALSALIVGAMVLTSLIAALFLVRIVTALLVFVLPNLETRRRQL